MGERLPGATTTNETGDATESHDSCPVFVRFAGALLAAGLAASCSLALDVPFPEEAGTESTPDGDAATDAGPDLSPDVSCEDVECAAICRSLGAANGACVGDSCHCTPGADADTEFDADTEGRDEADDAPPDRPDGDGRDDAPDLEAEAERDDGRDADAEDASEADHVPVCGDGVVDPGEECDRTTPRGCGTPCSTVGAQDCVACAWGPCVPPAETCNGADEDCDGRTDDIRDAFVCGDACCGGGETASTCPRDCSTTPVVRPYVVLVVDTSGSMLTTYSTTGAPVPGGVGDTGGDGSRDPWGSRTCCPGTGTISDPSRLYAVKDALHEIASARTDAIFALFKFPQLWTTAGRTMDYYWGNQAPAAFDVLRYDGECSSSTVSDYRVVALADGNVPDLLMWTDHREYSAAGVPLSALERELRGDGPTPIGWVLARVEDYLASVLSTDDEWACRPYRVILLTDGAETCGGDPTAAATSLHATTGGGRTKDVRTCVATYAAGSIAGMDAMAAAGRCTESTTSAYYPASETELVADLDEMIDAALPAETCDGSDDDCDGATDEGFACVRGAVRTCTLGSCSGTQTCGAACSWDPCSVTTPEECNGLDDDCDGSTDEEFACSLAATRPCTVGACSGTQTCALGCVWDACTVTTPEECNGVDDDCDGTIDEGCPACVVCAGATALPSTGARAGGTLAAGTGSTAGSCGGAGAESVLNFTTAEVQDVFLTTHGSQFDTVLYVRDCDCGGTEVACNDDDPDATGLAQSTLHLRDLPAGTYNVFVDAKTATDGGDFQLDFYSAAPGPSGDRCGDPIHLAAVGDLAHDSCPFSDDYTPSATPACDLAGTGGGEDLVYYFVLPAAGTVAFRTCTSDAFCPGAGCVDTDVYLRHICHVQGSQAACSENGCGYTSGTEQIHSDTGNFSLAAGIYYVFVDGYEEATGTWPHCGSYNLVVTGIP
ncbi:MAG: hypothetical protein HY905_09805 [Deltaproteobacteria bacterium]|nr:hypothetical protein [Deltaproteobacteria bacterium]